MTHIDELELVFQIKGATVASDIPSPQYQRMYERMFGFISQGDEDKALKSTALHQLIFDLSNALLAVQEVLAVDDEVTTNLVAENSRCSIELREGRVMFSLMAHVIINLNSAMTMPDFISWCTRHQGDLLKCFAMVAGNVQGGQFSLTSPVHRKHASNKFKKCAIKIKATNHRLEKGRAQGNKKNC